jgi:hypothetical protein
MVSLRVVVAGLTLFLGIRGAAAADRAVIEAIAPEFPKFGLPAQLTARVSVAVDGDSDGTPVKATAQGDAPSSARALYAPAAVMASTRWRFAASDTKTTETLAFEFRVVEKRQSDSGRTASAGRASRFLAPSTVRLVGQPYALLHTASGNEKDALGQ